MLDYGLLIGLVWLVFIIYWIISSFSAKKSVRRGNWWKWAWIRLIIFFIAVAVIRTVGSDTLRGHIGVLPLGTPGAAIGLLLCVAGVALAIWARAYLGSNWGMPMSLREGHELVTTGPYRYIRHPIYSGVILAMCGSVLADNILWFIPLACVCVYFIVSAYSEERTMLGQFPDEYHAYRARSNMLIPFIF